MAYNAVAQREHDVLSDETNDSTTSGSPPLPGRAHRDFSFQPLSLDFDHLQSTNNAHSSSGNLSGVTKSVTSNSASYDVLEDDDYEDPDREPNPGNISRSWTNAVQRGTENGTPNNGPITASVHPSPQPMMRIASSEGSVDLRHPTPDLQSLQGAYVENVERLERSAERLSMSSDIGEELRKMKMEQKRSESRRSSILGSPIEEGVPFSPPSRQFSSTSVSNSIVNINSAARSGGYSPAGYVVSPKGSIRSGSYSYASNRGRSASRGSRLTQLPEPDREGRPIEGSPAEAVPIIPPPIPPPHAHLTRDQNGVLHAIPQQYHNLPESHSPDVMAETDTGPMSELPDRPGTAASNETYKQVKSLFVDFDGVHYAADEPHSPEEMSQERHSRRASLVRPTGGSRAQSYNDTLPGQNMVYYPAPVPAVLNLPKRLSKLPSADQREKRRSQILDALPHSNRKSAAWLPGLAEDEGDFNLEHSRSQKRKTMHPRHSVNDLSNVPSQLRASAFFDRPSEKQHVEIKGESAVATLDSILDASAYAPVTAFTDHPIAGHVGHEVYGRQSNRISTVNLMNKLDSRKSRGTSTILGNQWRSNSLLEEASRGVSRRFSQGTLLERKRSNVSHIPEQDEHEEQNQPEGEKSSLRQTYEWGYSERGDDRSHLGSDGYESAVEELQVEEDGEAEEPTTADEPEYFGAPTTLLAELQLRKQQQKQRNRTAATAFPNGMHSTLLQLDAVAQVQKKARQNKRTALAWEDPNTAGQGSPNDEDDDVPLGVLFPGRAGLVATNNPQGTGDKVLGLMESREIEDNEPLSRRRARLRTGAPITRDRSPAKPSPMKYQLEVCGVTDALNEDEDEDETLAQRMRRLKGGEGNRPASRAISAEFASEMMNQLGGGEGEPTAKNDMKSIEPEEETLGQRRKRLQVEKESRSRNVSGEGDAGNKGRPQLRNTRSTSGPLQANLNMVQRQALHASQPVPTAQVIPPILPSNSFPQQTSNNGMMHGAHAPSMGAYGAGYQAVNLGMDGNVYGGGPMGYINPAFYNNNSMAMGGFGSPIAYNNTMLHSPSTMAMGGYGYNMPYGKTIASTGGATLPFGHGPADIDPNQRAVIDEWRQSIMH